MMRIIAIPLMCLFPTLSASATVYSCQSDAFCRCQKADGCHAVDQYISDAPNVACKRDNQIFKASVHRRKIALDGPKLKATFWEARPYFTDLDWYQAGATKDRGLLDLAFDNESRSTDFEVRQMVESSVNDHIWTLTGTCKVIE